MIPLRCRLDDYTGYGQFTVMLIQALVKIGVQVESYPVSCDFRETDPPEPVRNSMRKGKNHMNLWELLLYSLSVGALDSLPLGKKIAFWTMWETTRLPLKAIALLNQSKVVIVPSRWCETVFSANHVNSQIRIVPLGIDVDKFQVSALPCFSSGNFFTFGTMARWQGGGVRKGYSTVLEAFLKAFPNEKDVRLLVKGLRSCPIQNSEDDRIQISKEYIPRERMPDWYQGIDVFVSGSSSEGWGLCQQESMCSGRPVISVDFGGVQEFWSRDNGYAVRHILTEGKGCFQNHGHYAEPDVESMAEQMRKAYSEHGVLVKKASLAAESARRFTMENSARELLNVLKEFKFL